MPALRIRCLRHGVQALAQQFERAHTERCDEPVLRSDLVEPDRFTERLRAFIDRVSI